MTTATSTSVISHANTTQFRAWGLELSNMLTTIGFIKSADTGQINWGTVTRPAVGVSGGYEIRYMNDSLHGTAPIYVKLEYGTDAVNAAYPAMWITIGTGSSGAGAITGTVIAREQFQGGAYPLDSIVAAKASYACMSNGCVWFAFKTKNRNTSFPAFVMSIERTKDNAGASTGDGFVFHRGAYLYGNASSFSAVYIFATGYTITSAGYLEFGGGSGGYAFMPYGIGASGTIVGGVPGNMQLARHYLATPEIRPLLCTVSQSVGDAITEGTTFTATVLGVTSHTYMSLERAFSNVDHFGAIWE